MEQQQLERERREAQQKAAEKKAAEKKAAERTRRLHEAELLAAQQLAQQQQQQQRGTLEVALAQGQHQLEQQAASHAAELAQRGSLSDKKSERLTKELELLKVLYSHTAAPTTSLILCIRSRAARDRRRKGSVQRIQLGNMERIQHLSDASFSLSKSFSRVCVCVCVCRALCGCVRACARACRAHVSALSWKRKRLFLKIRA